MCGTSAGQVNKQFDELAISKLSSVLIKIYGKVYLYYIYVYLFLWRILLRVFILHNEDRHAYVCVQRY